MGQQCLIKLEATKMLPRDAAEPPSKKRRVERYCNGTHFRDLANVGQNMLERIHLPLNEKWSEGSPQPCS